MHTLAAALHEHLCAANATEKKWSMCICSECIALRYRCTHVTASKITHSNDNKIDASCACVSSRATLYVVVVGEECSKCNFHCHKFWSERCRWTALYEQRGCLSPTLAHSNAKEYVLTHYQLKHRNWRVRWMSFVDKIEREKKERKNWFSTFPFLALFCKKNLFRSIFFLFFSLEGTSRQASYTPTTKSLSRSTILHKILEKKNNYRSKDG